MAYDDRKEGRRDWHRGGSRDRRGNDDTSMILVECIFLSYIDMNQNIDVKDSIDHEFYSCVFKPLFSVSRLKLIVINSIDQDFYSLATKHVFM